MKYTANYNLKKPEGTDTVNIDDFNNNADILDTEINSINEQIDTLAIQDDSFREQINNLESNLTTIETATLVEGYFTSRNIPTTAKRGLLDVKLFGNTAVNLVKNGNFVDTSNWELNGVSTVISNGRLYIENAIGASAYAVQNNALIVGHIYYALVNAEIIQNTLTFMSSGFPYFGITQTGNTSGIFTAQATTVVISRSSSTAVSKAYVDNVLVIDLTATFGTGNEPTKEQCDIMFPTYFDGLQGSTGIEVLSVGKNVLNEPKKLSDFTITSPNASVDNNLDGSITLNTNSTQYSRFQKSLKRLKPNTVYTVSVDGYGDDYRSVEIIGTQQLALLESPVLVRAVLNSVREVKSFSFTTPNDGLVSLKYYVSTTATTNKTMTIYSVHIEEGTTATPYEPYKPTSVLYKTLDGKPVTLHRLPNGVRDEIDENGRKVERCLEYELKESDVTAYVTSGINNDRIRINKPLNAKCYGNGTQFTVDNNITFLNYIPVTYADTIIAIGGIYVYSSTQFEIIVPKNTYPTLADAQKDVSLGGLAGTKIVYQKATPSIIVTNATPLIAEPNGTVFISSESSPLPASYMEYTNNVGAVIDGLIDGQKELTDFVKDRVIEESGSNENGSYVRFADGTQICYIEVVHSSISLSVSGSMYTSGTLIVNYPASFINNPLLYATPRASTKRIFAQIYSSTLTYCMLVITCTESVTIGSLPTNVLAIGRWK